MLRSTSWPQPNTRRSDCRASWNDWPEAREPIGFALVRNVGELFERVDRPDQWGCDGAADLHLPERSGSKEAESTDWEPERNAGSGGGRKPLTDTRAQLYSTKDGDCVLSKAHCIELDDFRKSNLLHSSRGSTLPLHWLCQLPLCRFVAEERLQAIIRWQQVNIPLRLCWKVSVFFVPSKGDSTKDTNTTFGNLHRPAEQEQLCCCWSCLPSRRKTVLWVRLEIQRSQKKTTENPLYRNYVFGKCPAGIRWPGNALECRRESGKAMELAACQTVHSCPAERSPDRNVSADYVGILPRAFCVQGNELWLCNLWAWSSQSQSPLPYHADHESH